MQLNITLREIQHLATNGKVFARGKQYAQNGHVKKLAYAPAHHLLLAYVQSTDPEKNYLVQIALSQRERPKRISCTCPAAKEYQGCCKHMVAVFVAAQNLPLEKMENWNDRLPPMVERQNPRTRADVASPSADKPGATEPQGAEFMNRLRAQALRRPAATDRPAEETAAFALHLQLQLPRLTLENCLLTFQLEELGQHKLYKIKKPELFLQQLAAGQLIKLSPNQNFDPQNQRCDAAGERFLAWLGELHALTVERNEGEYLSKSALFRNELIVLNPQRLWDFCERFAADFSALNLHFTRGSADESLPLSLQDHFPPLRFRWSALPPLASAAVKTYDAQAAVESPREDAGRALSLVDESGQKVSVYSPLALKAREGHADLRLLTRDARLLFYQDRLYRLRPGTPPLLGLLLDQLSQTSGAALLFDPPNAQECLSRIHKELSAEQLLQLDTPLDSRLIQSPLRSFIWLDQEGRGLQIQLFFYYEPYCYSPHPSAAGLWWQFELNGENTAQSLPEDARPVPCPELIRDLAQEQAVLDSLKRYGCIEQRLSRRAATAPKNAAPISAAYYLFGDQALLNFFDRGCDELRALGATLFLSKALRRRPLLRNLPPLSGRLQFSSDNQLLALELEDWPYSQEELQAMLAAYREKRQFARLKDGSFIRWGSAYTDALEDAPEASVAVQKANQSLSEAEKQLELLERLSAWGAVLEGQALVLPPYRALPLSSLLKKENEAAGRQGRAAAFSESNHLSALREELMHPSGLKFDPPAGLGNILRSYQKAGFNWLCSLDYFGLGGILADDMGLGKTLQALSFIAHIRLSRSEPILVAAPTSLIYNWKSEAEKFVPGLKLLLLEGQKAQRIGQISEVPQYDLVVCSYSVLRQDIKELRNFNFAACFIDEAQFIKNPNTQTARAVKRIRAVRRFALTGTPVENRLSELWSIFDFLMPGYLFSQARFQKDFELPISRERAPAALAELRLLTAPFILRRLKKEVLKELPDKIETQLSCEMGRTQEKIYLAYLAEAQKELRQIQDKDMAQRSRMQILSLITRLRQICCHPALFLSRYEGGSTKLDELESLLERLIEGSHSALIFSQFTGMLELTAKRLEAKGLRYFYLDGAVSARERLERVQRFNAGERPIFLISLKAGGTGLNLTRADCVIHLDPWWNPAVEDQASDRAHRIGQARSVQVFRLVTRNSIEEKIMALQDEKRRLIAEIIQAEGDQLRALSLDDLKALLG